MSVKTEDQRAVQSRAAILESGIRTLLVHPGAGMSEIALAAGVGRATLYRHFDTKETLTRALARRCLQETDEILEPARSLKGRAALEAIIDCIVPLADRFRFLMSLWTLAANDRSVMKIYKRQLDELSETIEQAKISQEIRKDLPTSWLVKQFDASLNAAWEMVESGEIDSGEAATYFHQSFFSGCET
jgi:AcrR family transcriptional regulator